MARPLRNCADLLRAMSIAEGADPALLAQALGCKVAGPEGRVANTVAQSVSSHPQSATESPPVTLVEAMRPLSFWVLDAVARLEARQFPAEATALPQLQAQTVEPQVPPLPRVQLWREGDWENIWDSLIAAELISKRIDERRATQALAKRLPLEQLPRCTRSGSYRPLVLLVDYAPSLRPVHRDISQMIQSLRRRCGEQLAAVYLLPSGPSGVWRDEQGKAQTQVVFPRASDVYLVGDFAQNGKRGESDSAWSALHQQLHAAGHRLRAIAWTAAQGAPADEILQPQWCLDSRPLCHHQALLSALSQCFLPTMNKLRRLRLAIPGASLADELWVYNHPDVAHRGRQLLLPPKTLLAQARQYREIPAEQRAAIEACIAHWQAHHQGETAREIERVQQARHDLSGITPGPRLSALCDRVGSELSSGSVGASGAFMRGMLPLIQSIAPQVESNATWQALLHRAQRLAMHEGRVLPWGSNGLRSTENIGYLRQVGDTLHIGPRSPLCVMDIALGDQSYCAQTKQILDGEIRPNANTLEIIDGGWRYRLMSLQQPQWAERFYRNADGHIEAVHAEGARFRLIPASHEQPQSRWQLVDGLWRWAHTAGVDQHGLWAELKLDQVNYRLRWIPPGRFLMGSPADEVDRDDDEQQHPVTLSQGYWLGETTVTQGLWRAVMRDNPVDGEPDGRAPVTKVSWDDCQAFLIALRKTIPGFTAALPTEAQWEYACRAGTQTAFWWGDNWSDEHGHQRGKEWSEHGLPTNAFGLKSMHGNIDEWCQDWYAAYPAGAAVDPQGPPSGHARVMRGGSRWLGPRSLRAANRRYGAPVYRRSAVSLRLAGGIDPRAGQRRGVAQSADRGAGTAPERGAQGHTAPEQNR